MTPQEPTTDPVGSSPSEDCLEAIRPGSNEAIDAGCTCPVIDNAHGAGYLGLGKVWVMRIDCPIHGKIAASPPKP